MFITMNNVQRPSRKGVHLSRWKHRELKRVKIWSELYGDIQLWVRVPYWGKINDLTQTYLEISIEARDPYVEVARVALEEHMMKAATLAGFDGLKAGAKVGDTWLTAH